MYDLTPAEIAQHRQAVSDILSSNISVNPSARVIVEWNHNRYTPVSTVDNFGYPEKTYGYDLDLYPISSIIEPLRPTAGLMKARAGEGYTTPGYSDIPDKFRSYTASIDAKYKYWTSPSQSDGTKAITNCRPYIIYNSQVLTNKIYLAFENSWSSPLDYDIEVTDNGSSWNRIGGSIVPDSEGRVILYRHSNGWSTSSSNLVAGYIRGIRLTVRTMSRGNSYFNLIEMGARLEVDMTPRLIDYSVSLSISDQDFISPVGVISSNTGSVSLSNYDLALSPDNESSIYANLIDANAMFTIDIGYEDQGQIYYVRQATMFAESWNDGSEGKVDVELKDASKYLQEITPLNDLMEDITVGNAIWRILDSVGFNNYKYDKVSDESSYKIPFFWTNSDDTVWDQIKAICRGTQSAVYFDEYGVLRIKTKESAFNKSQPVQWTFSESGIPENLPDIVDLDISGEYEANKVVVEYKPTKLAEDANGNPISEVLWQPEGDVVLRASALRYDLPAGQPWIWMDQRNAAVWPYEGAINIRGEIIKYKGKQYSYYASNGVMTRIWIYNDDDKRRVDNTMTKNGESWRNSFNGCFLITERGVDVTNDVEHDANIKKWTDSPIGGGWYGTHAGTQKRWDGGIKWYPEYSTLRLQTQAKFTTNNWWYNAWRTVGIDGPNRYFGTRMKFPSNPKGSWQIGGIFFSAHTSDHIGMYGVELISTAQCNRANRAHKEVRILKRKSSGVTVVKEVDWQVAENNWYDIDVSLNTVGSIGVFINGVLAISIKDLDPIPLTGRTGLYVRGYSVADFEYFYASRAIPQYDSDLDNMNYLDMIKRGYYSNQYYKDMIYGWRVVKTRRGNKTVTVKDPYVQRVFDEFGEQIHEMRTYNVKFEKSPAVYSSLYISNSDQSIIDEYVHSPFGATFTIANSSRTNAVINGEDTLTFGADNSVEQKMMIVGRTVQQADAKTYEVKDDQAIRARGEISVSFASDWIQSEAQAKSLGDWIIKNWADPADEIELEVFGNPLIQLSSIVAIDFPSRSMSGATHKYFVTGISNSWSEGLSTTLVLRRAF